MKFLPLKPSKIILTKRRKILLISFILTLLFIFLEAYHLNLMLKIILLGFFTYLFSLWALDFDVKGQEYIIFPLLPIFTSCGAVLSTLILKQLSLLPLIFPAYFIGMYLILLTANILNISTVKSIPLINIAWSTLFICYFVISFLVLTMVFWYNPTIFWSTFSIFLIIFVLSYPVFYFLVKQLGRGDSPLIFMIFCGLILAEIGWILSFWALPFYIRGLVLATIFYLVLGILEHHLKARFSKKLVWEDLVIVVFIIFIIFRFSSWHG